MTLIGRRGVRQANLDRAGLSIPHGFRAEFRQRLATTIAGAGMMLFGSACASVEPPWRGQTDRPEPVIHLADYVGEPWQGRRLYLRTNLRNITDAPESFERLESTEFRSEGCLSRVRVKSLSEFLHNPQSRNRVVRFPWPDKLRPVGPAFFIEFTPSVAEWPEEVAPDRVSTIQAKMVVFDRAGNPFAEGIAQRLIKLKGFESIDVLGIKYARSLVLDSEITFRFGWWATFRLHERLWLTEDRGLIRRREHMQGSALLVIRFDSDHLYELIPSASAGEMERRMEHKSGSSSSEGCRTRGGCAIWKRMAICLDRDVPNPRVAGILIEYESPP